MESLLKQVTNQQTRAIIANNPDNSRRKDEEINSVKVVQFASKAEEKVIPDDDLEGQHQESNQGGEKGNQETTSIVADAQPSSSRNNDAWSRLRSNLGSLGAKSHQVRAEEMLNVDTGVSANRECIVEVVTGLTQPMNPLERRRREFLGGDGSLLENQDGGRRNLLEQTPQYRLNSKTNGHDTKSTGFGIESTGFGIANMFNYYIHWSFKTGIMEVIATLTAFFYMFTTIFAVLIAGVGWYQPNCIYVGSENFGTGGSYFIDAFAISWTTFSTVGYGLTGPAVSNIDRCIFLNIFTATEAFFGVLYAGFAGAVIFGKITRMNSVAKVLWSDPICVRYGSGVDVETKDLSKLNPLSSPTAATATTVTSTGGEDDDEEDEDEPLLCPILEFRIINTFFARNGGEIANAMVTVWASTRAEDASASIREAAKLPRRRNRKRKPSTSKNKLNRINLAIGNVAHGVGNVATGVGHVATDLGKSVGAGVGNLATGMAQTAGNVANGVAQTVTGKKSPKGATSAGSPTKEMVALRVDKTHAVAGSRAKEKEKEVKAKRTATVSNVLYSITRKNAKTADGIVPEAPETAGEEAVEMTVEEALEEGRAGVLQELSKMSQSTKHMVMTEDPTNILIPQIIYSRLDIETDSHPFFKRVWTVRHILNENSALLDTEAQKLIRANGGCWPAELNDFKSVRKHLRFNELIVIFSGTDHVAGNTVYSQHVYDYVDVNIGYRFANPLIIDPRTKSLRVDPSLINDVLEQHGGGAEPFTDVVEGDATIVKQSPKEDEGDNAELLLDEKNEEGKASKDPTKEE